MGFLFGYMYGQQENIGNGMVAIAEACRAGGCESLAWLEWVVVVLAVIISIAMTFCVWMAFRDGGLSMSASLPPPPPPPPAYRYFYPSIPYIHRLPSASINQGSAGR